MHRNFMTSLVLKNLTWRLLFNNSNHRTRELEETSKKICLIVCNWVFRSYLKKDTIKTKKVNGPKKLQVYPLKTKLIRKDSSKWQNLPKSSQLKSKAVFLSNMKSKFQKIMVKNSAIYLLVWKMRKIKLSEKEFF